MHGVDGDKDARKIELGHQARCEHRRGGSRVREERPQPHRQRRDRHRQREIHTQQFPKALVKSDHEINN